MASIRVKIILNKGGVGIAVEKLSHIAKEAEKFIEGFSKDMHLGESNWIADRFRNGSVIFDLVYVGEASDAVIKKSQKALKLIANPKTTAQDLDYGVSKTTFLQFARMAAPVEVDEAIGVGVYNGSKRAQTFLLTKQRFVEIEKQILRRVEHYGSIRGTITALFKGNFKGKEQSTLWINDQLTNQRVVCTYPAHYYNKIVKLLEDRDGLVNAEGWMTLVNGEIEKLAIKTLEPLETYQKGDIEKLFGSDPDFTGGLSTEEFIEQIRGRV